MSDAPPTPDPLDAAGRELRPPANALLGFTDLLLASSLAKEQQEYVETIRACGEEILQLSGDLLDLAGIESGRIALAPAAAPFEPLAAVGDAIALLERESAARGFAITHHADPGLPHQLVGDAGRFRQVVLSVLRNVFKAVEGPRIEVALTWGPRTGAGDPALGFEVRELPPGEGSRPGLAGSFGLSVARRLCESLGGGLEAAGEVPPGAPLIRGWVAAALESEAAAAAGSVSPAGSLRILVVEDNPVNQRLLLALLRRIGFAAGIGLAANGEEALQKLRELPFDLVFMDVQMPVMDGFECTRRIRLGESGPRHAAIQIVAVTAGAMRGDREKCLEAGMDEYLSKPISSSSLEAVLAQVRGALAKA